MKKTLFILIKLFISIILLTYIFYKINGAELLKSLSLLKFSTVILAILIGFSQVFLMGIRWNFIQKSFSLRATLKDSLDYTWMGHFFSLCLPGGIVGGDVVKGWYMKKAGIRLKEIGKVLLVEKIQILLSLLILCLPFLATYFSFPFFIAGVAGLISAYSGIYLFFRRPYLIRITTISMLPNLLACLISYLFVNNFDASKTFMEVAQVTPVTLLLGALPISFGGWGIREGASIYCLSLIGVPVEQALAIALATTGVALVASTPGFFTWLKIRRRGDSICAA